MNPSIIHHFDVEHAQRYGMTEAVLITNFQHWITRNKANGDHFRDGRTWTYNSVRAFAQQFPYLSADQIRRALDRLVALGVLVTGNYNAKGRDRTRWFAFADESAFIHIPAPIPDAESSHLANLPNGKIPPESPEAPPALAQSHLAKLPDGTPSHLAKLPNPFGKSAKCLITTDVNTDVNKTKRGARAARASSPWWASDASVLAEGRRLSLEPLSGETMPQFKARVQAAHAVLSAGRPPPSESPQPSPDVIAARRASLARALGKAEGGKS